jgi:hypothetical protein
MTEIKKPVKRRNQGIYNVLYCSPRIQNRFPSAAWSARGSFLTVPDGGGLFKLSMISRRMFFCYTHQVAPLTEGKTQMLLSINQLFELTGRDRKTIKQKLEGLPFANGEKSAHLYNSREVLPLIYAADNLEAARAAQARSQASLNAYREEVLRKTRIPIEIVEEVWDEVFQSIAATLKSEAAKHRPLTREIVNSLFDKFRAAPKRLKW